MTTAADVIAAFNLRRQRKSLRPEVPGQLPAGWQGWLDALPVLNVDPRGPAPETLVEVFAQRPLRAIPRRAPALTRLQAVSSLLQQEWDAPSDDERGLRVVTGAIDLLLHLLLATLLLWLMYLGLVAISRQQPEEDSAVQVEFIGRGNVAEGGGAIANAGADSAPAAAASPTQAATPAPSSGRPDAGIERVETPSMPQIAASEPAQQAIAQPALPTPVEAAQPLQVSEVPTPDPQSFQLPPPREASLTLPQAELRQPQLSQQVEAIPTLRQQAVRVLQPRETQPRLRTPELQQQPRDLDVPVSQRMRTISQRATPAAANQQAQVRVPELRGQVRDIPLPPGGAPMPSSQAGNGAATAANASNPGAGGERGNAASAGQAPAGTGQGVKPAAQGGRGITSAGAGAGPVNRAAPGGWPGAAKSDDWGASNRNVAGTGNGNGRNGDGSGKPGLFNDDGSVRLPDEWTQISGVDVDRSGTWLKRPGLEYRGTRFDQYWVPQGTLLEEWVRRGIKKIAIPIPGSRRRLECVVSLLQLGGGCFPVNPDVNEQPATARPPPDIPFKPELQEDNGSAKPAN